MREHGQQIRVQLECLMRQAGALLMSYYQKPLSITHQKQKVFTEADHAVEEFLKERLVQLIPEASVYAEESGPSGSADSLFCWVIDPLDGTTNFVHGLPYFCISVALTLHNEPVIGAIYQPILDELFYAERGVGAWLNGVPLAHKQHVTAGIQLMVASPWSGFTHTQASSTLRYCGAVALDCAYLADGRYDGLELTNLAWWDVAAGIVLLKEAGVPLTYTGGVPPDFTVHCLKAGVIAQDPSWVIPA